MASLRILFRASTLRVLAGLLGVGMAGGMSWGMAWAQTESEGPSLAELARKKKKDDKKSAHVYSDENLPKAGADFGGSSSSGASPAPASGSASAGAPAAEGAAAPSAAGEGEAKAGEPGPDLAAAKEKVETAKANEQSAQRNIKKLEGQLEGETSEFRRETYRQALENAQGSQAEFKRLREEAEKEEAAAEAAEGKKKKKKKPAATEETPQ